ncbi:four helix bundle protein [Niastella koreensis]|uniref:S23 ribosomal protein n=2 Tax=Niastella koreensis TaxID=354356 RepID=G8T701_NIAKG|nr:four helix bundle protein [Niastella koreensis]AEV99022.1 S23 ribosomal protein [Niastella koreensis GR20-10]OQP43940.1 four helix bundle protein [Niastella koreensis]
MSTIKSFRHLIVWQKSMNLVTEIYKTTRSFPSEELYALTSQLRRCAVSIPSNIAEGYGRSSTLDYKRFLRIAVGSIYELQTQIEIASNLKYLSSESFGNLSSTAKEIELMLFSLINKLIN